ncbi:MAG: hypothetical protein K1X74_00165 [Pirellulales bacterium]|nr:hypothetical protein [Pirellulales bacterium]
MLQFQPDIRSRLAGPLTEGSHCAQELRVEPLEVESARGRANHLVDRPLHTSKVPGQLRMAGEGCTSRGRIIRKRV